MINTTEKTNKIYISTHDMYATYVKLNFYRWENLRKYIHILPLYNQENKNKKCITAINIFHNHKRSSTVQDSNKYQSFIHEIQIQNYKKHTAIKLKTMLYSMDDVLDRVVDDVGTVGQISLNKVHKQVLKNK